MVPESRSRIGFSPYAAARGETPGCGFRGTAAGRVGAKFDCVEGGLVNIAKLQKLKDWIIAEPRRYNQKMWIVGPRSIVVQDQNPPCGTAGCLAGNACLMEGFKADKTLRQSCVVLDDKGCRKDIQRLAQKILDLTDIQAGRLFHCECEGWPLRAQILYQESKAPEQRAEAAAMAIDDLIAKARKPKRAKS
jgi:hypothetical protein